MADISPNRHAVVLGASIAGLLAARVLADHFERVTIVEKDRLPPAASLRKAVPQGVHVHGILARGLDIMEAMFPGLTDELVAGGAALIGPGDVRIYILGWRMAHDSPLKVVTLTRPYLEWTLANRVRSLPRVTISDATEAIGPQGTRSQITGVTVRNDGATRDLACDFIVDARGRASNLADWMKALGMKSPPHETSPLGSVYCSCLYDAGNAPPDAVQVVRMEDKLGALAFPVEGNRVLLSIGANTNAPMPKSQAEVLDLLKNLPVPDAYDAVKDLRPLTPLAFSRFTASVRRNFHDLAELPAGIVALGDAVASFNPVFGQGMTVAALEAEWLDACLKKGDPATAEFAKDYYDGVKPIVDLAWGLPDLESKRDSPHVQSWATQFLLWYTERMQATAARSAYVSRTIAEVQNMILPPAALFRPAMLARVLFS
jgi:2-polyprenyl-6-methoxyphenol hydroxylase-like FAD-dependent oxidoreductase